MSRCTLPARAEPTQTPSTVARRVALPLTGLAIFVYVLTLVLFDQNPATQRVADVTILLLVAVYAAETLLRGGKIHMPAPLVWYLLFLIFVTFQMSWAPGSVNMLVALYLLFLVSVVLVNYGVTSGIFPIELGYAVGIICTFVYIYISGETPEDGRYVSTMMNTNLYAWLLIVGMFLGFRYVLLRAAERKILSKKTFLVIAFIGLSIFGILYLSGSRKALVILMVSVAAFIMYILWTQSPRRRVLMSVPLIGVLALVGYWVYQSPKFERLADIANIVDGGAIVDTGVLIRGQLLQDAVHLWVLRPFTGWGLDQFTSVSGWGMYAHDNYVELLANHGAIGFGLYLMVYVSLITSLARSFFRSREARVSAETFWAMTVAVMMLVWDLGAVSYYGRVGWSLLSVLIVVSVTARLRTGTHRRTGVIAHAFSPRRPSAQVWKRSKSGML